MSSRTWLLTIAVFLLTARPVLSHRPRLVEGNSNPQNAYFVDDAEISWAFYADLETDGRVEYFRFSLDRATELAPELLVPDEPVFDDFEPTFVIYTAEEQSAGAPPAAFQPAHADTGAGSGAQFPLDATAVPVQIPAGTHALAATRMNEDVFEGFTRKSYRRVAFHEAVFPAGEYGVAVYSPAKRTGEYVFVIGKEEQFDGSDFAPMVNGCGPIFY